MSNRLVQLELFHLHLPFRGKFSHATAERSGTDTVVAAALLADGTVGYGEGVPRVYVTGETIESVLYNISDTLRFCLEHVEPKNFPDLLELVDNLPYTNEQGAVINTARCCVELALLDAYGQYFRYQLSRVAGWLGYGAFVGDRPRVPARASGVLDGSRPERLMRQLRLMRWYGLRDFKLKLGCEHDEENLALVHRYLERGLERREVTLRVDANGAWDIDTAMVMSERLADLGVCVLEQPLAKDDRDHWNVLADFSETPLMADESLVSLSDGRYLAENDLVDHFNIRMSKNGGLLPALRLAEMATKWSRGYQLGAMVGESGILAAAGCHFLSMVPENSFTEICYSTFLLQEDLVQENMRFRYRGKLPDLRLPGLGVRVRRSQLAKFLVEPTRKIPLD